MNNLEELSKYPEIGRLAALEKEKKRLEELLGDYLTDAEAADTAEELFEWALELEEIARRITAHPQVKKDFNYDGRAFVGKDPLKVAFHKSADGLEFLRGLGRDNLGIFFDAHSPVEPRERKRKMMAWIEKEMVDLSRARLDSLREGEGV